MEFRLIFISLCPDRKIVSILVFLDMEFRHDFGVGDSLTTASFNPCFSGYGIQTFGEFAGLRTGKSFNPCFSGYGIQTLLHL